MLVEKSLMERGFRKQHFHQMRRHQKRRRGGENLLHPTIKTDLPSPFQAAPGLPGSDLAASGGQPGPEASSPTAVGGSARSTSLPLLDELALSPVVRRHLQKTQHGGNFRQPGSSAWFSPVGGDSAKDDEEHNWNRRRLPAMAVGSQVADVVPEPGEGHAQRRSPASNKLRLPPAVPVTPTTARKRLESRYRRECGAVLTPSRKQRPNSLALQHGWASSCSDQRAARSESAQALRTLGRSRQGASASESNNGQALQHIHSQLELAVLGSLGANAFTDHTRARKQRKAEVSLPSHKFKRRGKRGQAGGRR